MKSTANGWLFVLAALGIALALFFPLSVLQGTLPRLESFGPSSFFPPLAWFLAAAAFWCFVARFWPNDPRERRRLNSLALLLFLQAILIRLVTEIAPAKLPLPWPWLPQDSWMWVPWFAIPALAAILLGARFGVVVCLTGGLMLYLRSDPGPLPFTTAITSGLVGILLLRRSPTRNRVLRAGLGTGCTLTILAGSYYAVQRADLEIILAAMAIPGLLAVLSAFAVLAVLPVLEWMLGELSDVTLIEYGTDHPLLDQLRVEAPGTWHHTLNVADLAEKAAAEAGARALFCKTAALYHDIGKLKEPALFAENNDGPSPHEFFDPQTSAQRIIEHVHYGLELARKHGLPKPFWDIIAEHHGKSVVRVFYAKACESIVDRSKDMVSRSSFSYPGPAPSTRESGIIALADAVEAASRSVSLRSEAELRGFVRKLICERISEGEMTECPLTLSDLAKIESAFVAWLKGRNHYRPAYPEPVKGSPADRELVAPEFNPLVAAD